MDEDSFTEASTHIGSINSKEQISQGIDDKYHRKKAKRLFKFHTMMPNSGRLDIDSKYLENGNQSILLQGVPNSLIVQGL